MPAFLVCDPHGPRYQRAPAGSSRRTGDEGRFDLDTRTLPGRSTTSGASPPGPRRGLQTPAAALIVILVIGAVTALVFSLYPQLDVQFVALFYDPRSRTWPYADNAFLQGFRKSNTVITVMVAVAAAAALALRVVRPQARLLMSARVAIFLLATLAVGPGLVTNTALKPYWGRPRPQELTQFGETLDFVAWWNPFGRCDSNCSFVSGEASSAFWLLALAVVLPARYRVWGVLAVVVYGLAIGLARIAMGGHFVTDVAFAGVFTALAIWLVHGVIFRWSR